MIPRHFVVFNAGSSSLGYKVYRVQDPDSMQVLAGGKAHRVGVTGAELSSVEHVRDGVQDREEVPLSTHREAADHILGYLQGQGVPMECVGHRFVHGGSLLTKASLLDDQVLGKLSRCVALAPIHNPAALEVIGESRRRLPEVPQYVSLDSAFHATIPARAHTYAIPASLARRYALRKYGFHGLSYEFVSVEAARHLGRPLRSLRLVVCHLGTGGSSVAAIQGGESVDTSMGYSPLPGLMMSTRAGDVDPMLGPYLMAAHGWRADEVMDLLNRESGLLGISGHSSDIRDIQQGGGTCSPGSNGLALGMYAHRLRKYIGSYAVVLGGMDALVFTDDIGVTNWRIREEVCADMAWCGVKLDAQANRRAASDHLVCVSSPDSTVSVLTVPNDEELMICRQGVELFKEGS